MKSVNENKKDKESLEISKQKKLGGIKTLPFILANEICDRFAATGFHANLITYLTEQLRIFFKSGVFLVILSTNGVVKIFFTHMGSSPLGMASSDKSYSASPL
ncbi:hypothetical protein R6Q59_017719 [Mikania micrantha]